MSKKEHIIDAKGKRLGRVATAAASFLIGKDSPALVRHIPADVTVKIENASLMDISDKKRMNEEYQTYSGHPGGQKREKLGTLSARRGYGEALRRTISGMLPKNKLRSIRLKNLVISE
jgi:large subunit ribosomal protein L13